MEDFEEDENDLNLNGDSFEQKTQEELRVFFNENKSEVFYGRQLEVIFEDKYFHWITNRVLRLMVKNRFLSSEVRKLQWGGNITLYWHKSLRYYRRDAERVVNIVEKYSLDKVGSSIGSHGELMVLEGFAKLGFLLLGRNVRELGGMQWSESGHNLDMVLQRDGIKYGIEVKNTLGYIEKDEFEAKIEMCKFFGLRPVFVVRMLPKNWVQKLVEEGGFALILKYLLYPEYFDDLILLMRNGLRLPVDSPKSLYEGTMKRFEKWHNKHVN